jgi:regulator of sigma E protease
MLTVIIFLIVLGVLVFVHELGHFVLAKKAGVKVEEFGFGYPPRALTLGTKWGTKFSLNWIPFGGFVKIAGEDGEEEGSGVVFTQVSKKWQVAILVAGVVSNIIFAWFLFSVGFMIGLPTPVDNDFGGTVQNPALTVIDVLAGSPAGKAGLKTGDKILNESSPEKFSEFINNSSGPVPVKIERGGKILDFKITPGNNPSTTLGARKIIGISMDMVGTLRLPVHQAIWQGGKTTIEFSYLTIKGIANLIGEVFRGKANISEVSGPVGIIGLVGDASRLGFVYLMTFTALISINLAVINLVPFPALDGGRVAVVIIEAITKRKMNSQIIHTINNIGFAILIVLMVFITYRDILKLF